GGSSEVGATPSGGSSEVGVTALAGPAGKINAVSTPPKELVRTVGVVVSSSLEFARLSTDQSLAETITKTTGGDINPEAESVFRASEKSISLKDYGVWLFVGDCLARRWPAVSLFLEGRKS
ncbi:MAG: hypothetical protein QF437_34340, partial [Planctomycetota bacterium]|nr:hypothetical protein [Planctomycetota bacterium]